MLDQPSPGSPPRSWINLTRDRRLLIAVAAVAVLLINPQPAPLALPAAFQQAQAATAKQDYALAADLLSDAAARLPYDGLVSHRAGLADISAQRFDSAVRRLRTAAGLDGWTPALRVALGDAYLGQGDRASALEQWEAALPDLPANDGLLARLANSYEAEGRYAEAIDMLAALAKARPNDSAVVYRLALLTAATAPAEALPVLALAGDVSPPLRPFLATLQDAVEAGLNARDEAYTFGRVGFAFVQLKEWGLAELALSRAVTLSPEYSDAYAYLGLAQDMQGGSGLEAYETAVKLAPQSPLAQFFLGLHWRRQGKSGVALPYLKTAQTHDPDNPAIAAEIGGAYNSLRDLINAEIWFTEAVRLAPQNAEFWLLLARFYIDNEYHVADPGLPAARMAAGLNPDSALAADALGYALVLTGDTVNGEKSLERAVRLDPQLPSAYYHLGLLYASQGKTEAAKAALNHTLALDPQGAYGGLALKALAWISP